MSSIKTIQAREVLDSRGFPTIEADVILTNGMKGSAIVPSGASTGSFEALEKRDGDANRYQGKGVLGAIEGIHQIIFPAIKGFEISDQAKIDHELIALDGTANKSKLGANATLAVSLACAKAAAQDQQLPLYRSLRIQNQYYLPTPMMNLINGGVHADNAIDFQEFMIIPVGASCFSGALEMGANVFHALKKKLKAQNLNTNVGDEGGFAPQLSHPEAVLDLLCETILSLGYALGKDIALGLDFASNEFYNNQLYQLDGLQKTFSRESWLSYLIQLANSYPIISMEDAMAEEDWAGWQALTQALGDRVQLVGDDLFVTQTARLQKGITLSAANAILIKFNQIGTLTETLSAIDCAKQAGFATVISHRSGETEDTTIADLSVAVNAMQIKTGSLCRTDRTAKYNQLLRIECELGKLANYAGWQAFSKFQK